MTTTPERENTSSNVVKILFIRKLLPGIELLILNKPPFGTTVKLIFA